MDWPKNNKILSKILPITIGLIIACFGYFLRLQHFSDFPPINDTRDEYKYAFNGISLLKYGFPQSWSWFDAYKDFKITNIRGSEYRLVKPYFDDPPLFGLIMGAYSISKGMDSYDKVDSGALRWPMLKLASLNIILLFIVVYLWVNLPTAILSSVLYATIPNFILSSRLPLAENFLVTLSLVCLALLHFSLRNKVRLSLFILSLLSGCALLVKSTGIYIPVAIIGVFISMKKYREALFVFLSTILFGAIWFLYGAHYDWPLFINLQQTFSGREITLPLMVVHLFDTFRITEKMMAVDGILILGLISIFVYQFINSDTNKNKTVLSYISGSYLILFAIMSGHHKGWYQIPLHPLICWSLAALLIEQFKRPRFLPIFFIINLGLFTAYSNSVGRDALSQFGIRIYQYGLPVLMLPFAVREFVDKPLVQKTCQTLLILMFLACIIFNYQTIFYHQDQLWYK